MLLKSDIVCQSYANVYRGYFFPDTVYTLCFKNVARFNLL